MKKLPISWNKSGFVYKIYWRDENYCIAEQRMEEDGALVAYEVFEIRKLEAGEIMGNSVEAREAIPSNESWGTKGYTVWTLEKAWEKIEKLKQNKNEG